MVPLIDLISLVKIYFLFCTTFDTPNLSANKLIHPLVSSINSLLSTNLSSILSFNCEIDFRNSSSLASKIELSMLILGAGYALEGNLSFSKKQSLGMYTG